VDIWDVDADGIDDILLADVNNGYRSATLVVLDPRRVAGTSSQPDGDKSQIQGLERRKEKSVVLFSRSCINLLFEKYNLVRLLLVKEDTIRIETLEKRDDRDCVIAYTLDRRLTPVDVEFSDRFMEVHRQLELEGKLHPYSEMMRGRS